MGLKLKEVKGNWLTDRLFHDFSNIKRQIRNERVKLQDSPHYQEFNESCRIPLFVKEDFHDMKPIAIYRRLERRLKRGVDYFFEIRRDGLEFLSARRKVNKAYNEFVSTHYPEPEVSV